jgi:RecA-family ATPase
MSRSSPTVVPAAGGQDEHRPSKLDAPSRALTIEWWADIEPHQSARWLVDRLIPYRGLITLVGDPGSGKSFLALSLAAHVAAGRPWFGRSASAGSVIY